MQSPGDFIVSRMRRHRDDEVLAWVYQPHEALRSPRHEIAEMIAELIAAGQLRAGERAASVRETSRSRGGGPVGGVRG